MARMKFLCDAERCIECNACVTACKNEHEVPWGVNRRWSSPSMTASPANARFRSPACIARMRPASRSARWIASTIPRTVSCCIPRTSASVVATASTPVLSGHRSIPRRATTAAAARWTSAPSVPADPRTIILEPSSRSMVVTGLPKANCRFAPRCARPRRCLVAMAISSRGSTASGSSPGASARVLGAGALLISRSPALRGTLSALPRFDSRGRHRLSKGTVLYRPPKADTWANGDSWSFEMSIRGQPLID